MKKYNYFELCNILKKTALKHPMINNVYFNKYKLNIEDNIEYPALIFLHQNTTVIDNITNYNFITLYVDRLTDDRDNTLQIHSVGHQVIPELLNAIQNKYDIFKTSNITINVFKEQFADNVAGTSSNITLQTKNEIQECEWINNDCNQNDDDDDDYGWEDDY